MSNIRYFMKLEDIKTFCQGALGAMTFGMYSQYITANMIKQNDDYYRNMIKQNDDYYKNMIQQNDENHRFMIKELYKKLEKLENRRSFYFF